MTKLIRIGITLTALAILAGGAQAAFADKTDRGASVAWCPGPRGCHS